MQVSGGASRGGPDQFFSRTEYAGKRKKTQREVFLAEMELVVPWKALLASMARGHEGAHRGGC